MAIKRYYTAITFLAQVLSDICLIIPHRMTSINMKLYILATDGPKVLYSKKNDKNMGVYSRSLTDNVAETYGCLY